MENLVLRVPGADGQYRSIEIAKAGAIIGRDPSCDFVLSDTMVSRKHCHIYLENNQWIIEDQGSTHGTFLNNIRITKSRISSNDSLDFAKPPSSPPQNSTEVLPDILPDLKSIMETSTGIEKTIVPTGKIIRHLRTAIVILVMWFTITYVYKLYRHDRIHSLVQKGKEAESEGKEKIATQYFLEALEMATKSDMRDPEVRPDLRTARSKTKE